MDKVVERASNADDAKRSQVWKVWECVSDVDRFLSLHPATSARREFFISSEWVSVERVRALVKEVSRVLVISTRPGSAGFFIPLCLDVLFS